VGGLAQQAKQRQTPKWKKADSRQPLLP